MSDTGKDHNDLGLREHYDRLNEGRHDHELFVETAPFWQELTCPGCGESFDELLREGTAIRGSSCPECNDLIQYRFSRGEETEDTTEQTTLRTDGGTSDRERCGWCGNHRELVDDEHSSGYLVAGPDGDVLNLGFGLVCRGCWDHIEEEWRETGDLSKPLSAYGRTSA